MIGPRSSNTAGDNRLASRSRARGSCSERLRERRSASLPRCNLYFSSFYLSSLSLNLNHRCSSYGPQIPNILARRDARTNLLYDLEMEDGSLVPLGPGSPGQTSSEHNGRTYTGWEQVMRAAHLHHTIPIRERASLSKIKVHKATKSNLTSAPLPDLTCIVVFCKSNTVFPLERKNMLLSLNSSLDSPSLLPPH